MVGRALQVLAETTTGGAARAAATSPSFPSGDTLKAVLFDIDGTLCDSDPLHYLAFRKMLQEVGFGGGEPITKEFYASKISGIQNADLGAKLFPDWDEERREIFLRDKERLFAEMAAEKLKPVGGLEGICRWVEEKRLMRAAVTNAPRENAELMITLLGLSSFFDVLIVGGECKRPKPFPEPYQVALSHFCLSPHEALVFEDSFTGLSAATAAGVPAVGLATGNPPESLLQAGAAFIIHDYNDPKLWANLKSLH